MTRSPIASSVRPTSGGRSPTGLHQNLDRLTHRAKYFSNRLRDRRWLSCTLPGLRDTATSNIDFAKSTAICVLFIRTPPPFLAFGGRLWLVARWCRLEEELHSINCYCRDNHQARALRSRSPH